MHFVLRASVNAIRGFARSETKGRKGIAHMRSRTPLTFIAIACCAVSSCAGAAGCADSRAGSEEAATTNDSLSENDGSLTDDVDVQSDRLVFTNVARTKNKALSDLGGKVRNNTSGAPIVLVGKRNTHALEADGSIKKGVKNPNGYLRVATNVREGADGSLIVETRPATIFEAHEELERQGLIELTHTRAANGADDDLTMPAGDTPNGTDDNWEFAKNWPFTLVDIDLNRTLYEKQLLAGLGTVRIGFEDSFFRVNGNVDAYAAGRWIRPRAAHAILTTNLNSQLKIVARFDGAFAASTGDMRLYERQFAITSVAGYPLALSFEVTASCEFGANGKATGEAGISMTGSLKAGGEYVRNQGATLVWQPTYPTLTRIGPSLTSNARVEGLCTITAKAKAQVFDQDGPEAVTSAYVRVDANAQGSAGVGSASGTAHAKIVGGIDAYGAGTLQPFGVNLLEIQTPRFHKEWVLFDQNISVHL